MEDAAAGAAGADRKAAYAARKAKNRGSQQTVVTCALASRVRLPGLRDAIVALVDAVSRRAHKASLVLNATVVHCIDSGAPLPPLDKQATYIQCFKVAARARVQAFTPRCKRRGTNTLRL